MKKILVSKKNSTVIRIGIQSNGTFTEYDTSETQLLDIYVGNIKTIEKDHVTVDYGTSIFGILPIKNISEAYLNNNKQLEIDQPILVQIISEGIQTTLTTYITLQCLFLIFSPKNLNSITEKNYDFSEFYKHKKFGEEFIVNANFGVTVKNENEIKSQEYYEWELSFLIQLWSAIKDASKETQTPYLIFKDFDPINSPIKKGLSEGAIEIFIDDQELINQIKPMIESLTPDTKIYFYDLPENLIERNQWISWDVIRSNQKSVSKKGVLGKALSLFSK